MSRSFVRGGWGASPLPSGPAPDIMGSIDHYFTNYVVAQSNRFAHAAARVVAEAPATAHNPLIVWGTHGIGKTHLLRAIYHLTSALHPDLKVRWAPGATMVDDFTAHRGEGAWFSERMNDADALPDVLLIDDIQELGPEGKVDARSALLDVIERVLRSNRQVVMAADRSPHEIGDLANLVRNHERSLITDISAPDIETLAELRRRSRG
ncbi:MULTISPECIES: DnaA/Hda family protein [Mycobacteroides]|uniref:DnaA/Hda family protein n=1 Tax=Mycobacteroides TaxID=670516 RepID=UPI0009265868|nr:MULTISPECIES: DnaA/Hda family protein [Mycobacteroides]MBF9435252.1 ATP-binding protein [Mycobacteroides chelonae]MBN7507510.1 ATP-binding protein [Mycobacteroides abscessus subsp. massiliense]MDO3037428.1 DnaA/Hda family protein [Mycobacteroides abscessus subsp. abscessus]MDO3111311.1 DnaA/Hda family protein [Mycobacteroides abscessus subsp. massiliense]MDO3260460.1 DnaA/Hda family protein [Mycobacteroides abscessus subsp. abscessus]